MNSQTFCSLILAGLLLGGGAATAQTPRAGRAVPKPRLVATGVGQRDGLAMEKGRIVLTELGIINPLTADKKLVNGTVITPAGLVTAPDGTTTQMNEGDMASLTGRVVTRTAIVEADSLLKIKTFDLKYPGKRKKMEQDRERKEKIKLKRAEDKAKAKAKSKSKR